MEVIFKGSNIKNIEDFHKQIKEVLDLPDYYGENLDALWDCLTGWIDIPTTFIWEDFEYSKDKLGAFADKVIGLFKDAEKEIPGFKFECK